MEEQATLAELQIVLTQVRGRDRVPSGFQAWCRRLVEQARNTPRVDDVFGPAFGTILVLLVVLEGKGVKKEETRNLVAQLLSDLSHAYARSPSNRKDGVFALRESLGVLFK